MGPSLHFATLLVSLYARLAYASYSLVQDYSGDHFFGAWDFYSGQDYTHGFVKYQSHDNASSQGLISIMSGANAQKQAYVGVDFTRQTPDGRPSVRLESKASIGPGLVIADFTHTPGGICGTWPAFWLVGPNWPDGGEVDIIEGVNDQNQNAMTLHTSAGMMMDTSSSSYMGSFTGKMTTNNCDVNAPNQASNAGCSVRDSSTNSYGTGFNAGGGGVYATQWTDDFIKIWFFPRNSIPQDVQAGRPVPGDAWGKPSAMFVGKMNDYFQQQKIILDTTFCGDWAGAAWQYSSCASKAQTCNAYVRDNPTDFQDAYWLVNYIRVFQDNSGATVPSPSTPVSTRPVATVPTVSTRRPERTQTRTAIITITVPLTSTTYGPSETGPSVLTSSARRTRTRTKIVTITATRPSAVQTAVSAVKQMSRPTSPIRVGGAVLATAKL